MLIIRGAGLTGLASAARLARLGHDVTLETLGEPLGGAVPDVDNDPVLFDRRNFCVFFHGYFRSKQPPSSKGRRLPSDDADGVICRHRSIF